MHCVGPRAAARLSLLPPLVLGGMVGGELVPVTAMSVRSSDNGRDAIIQQIPFNLPSLMMSKL
jgi:hypothetical protein